MIKHLYQNLKRKFIASAIINCGLYRLFLPKKEEKLIIMFHGVTENPGNSVRNISTNEFIKTLNLLKKNFEIVSLDSIMNNATHSKPAIAITFDDGYLNNFTEAIPILEKYSLPATFFLITKSLANKNLILPIDFVDCIIDHEKPSSIQIDDQIFYHKDKYRSLVQGLSIYDYIIKNTDRMDQIQEQLEKQFNLDFYLSDSLYSKRAILVSKDELEKHLSKPLFSFQSHTYSHINLNIKMGKEKLLYELNKPIENFKEINNYPCEMIAFPYGEYNEDTYKTGMEVGYKYFLTVTNKYHWEKQYSNMFQRIGISNTTTAEVNFLNIIIQSRKKAFK